MSIHDYGRRVLLLAGSLPAEAQPKGLTTGKKFLGSMV
jgi:hypothetical protein